MLYIPDPASPDFLLKSIEESFARMDNYRRNPAFGLFEGRFQSNLNTYLKGSGRPQLPFNWTRNGYTWSWEDSTFGKIPGIDDFVDDLKEAGLNIFHTDFSPKKALRVVHERLQQTSGFLSKLIQTLGDVMCRSTDHTTV
ncbi:8765_t:CDS:2, partial [Rhizophagus irregularis]